MKLSYEDDDNQTAGPQTIGRRRNPVLEAWSGLQSCCVRGLTEVGDGGINKWTANVVAYLIIAIIVEGVALGYMNRVNPSDFDDLRAEWSTAGFVDVVVATSSCPAGYTFWGPKQTLPRSPQDVLSHWKGVQLCVNMTGTSNMYDSPCWQGSCENTVTGIQFMKGSPPSGTPPERIFTHAGSTYALQLAYDTQKPPLIYFTLNVGSTGEYCRSMSPGSPLRPRGCSVDNAGGPDKRYTLVDSYQSIANGARLLYQENGFADAAMEDQLNGPGSYAFVRSRTAIVPVKADATPGTCNSRRFINAIGDISDLQTLLLTDVMLLVGLVLVHFLVLRFIIAHVESFKVVGFVYFCPLLVVHCISLSYVMMFYTKSVFVKAVLEQCHVTGDTPGYAASLNAIDDVASILSKVVYFRYIIELGTASLCIFGVTYVYLCKGRNNPSNGSV